MTTRDESSSDFSLSGVPMIREPLAVLETMRSLLEQVWVAHADIGSPDYNQCDDGLCAWCEKTKQAADDLASVIRGIQEQPDDLQSCIQVLLDSDGLDRGFSCDCQLNTEDLARKVVELLSASPSLVTRQREEETEEE